MNGITRLAWAPVVIIGFAAGYGAGPSGSAIAQRTNATVPALPADQSGALNQVNGVHQPPEFKSTIPAPLLSHRLRTMWPNQPNESTFWSIDDIRNAHRFLAEADRAGHTMDPNTALHDFPYWTRTHAMFIKHVPQNARRPPADQHLGYAQFIVIMGGTGTVVAGGQLTRPTTLNERGREIPGEMRGSAITGGETFTLKDGDWVSIPPNSPSQFKADSVDGLTYMVMKINAQLYPWDLTR